MTSQTLTGWSWPDALDALVAASGYHTLLLENDNVRVVQTRIPSGHTVPVHTHRWAGVLFIRSWSDFVRRDAQGKVLRDTRHLAAQPRLDSPLWQEALPPHTIENVGGAEFLAVQVEIKDAG